MKNQFYQAVDFLNSVGGLTGVHRDRRTARTLFEGLSYNQARAILKDIYKINGRIQMLFASNATSLGIMLERKIQQTMDAYKPWQRYLFVINTILPEDPTTAHPQSVVCYVKSKTGQLFKMSGFDNNTMSKGDTVSCLVHGYWVKVEGEKIATGPRLSKPLFAETPLVFEEKSPEQWGADLKGYTKSHRYGNAFVCSCCHRRYGSSAGYKIEDTDYCFCNECYKKILPNWERHIPGREIVRYYPVGGQPKKR